MKRIMFIFNILSIILIANNLISCKKENSPGTSMPQKPISKLTVSVSSNTIYAYEPCTITWTSENMSTLTVNNIPFDFFFNSFNGIRLPDITQGTILSNDLIKDTTFVVNALGNDNKIYKQLFPIKVLENVPVVDRTNTLCSGYWHQVKATDWVNNKGTWAYFYMVPADNEYYYSNGTRKTFDKYGNNLYLDTKWEWVGKDSIKIGESNYKYLLTDLRLIFFNKGTLLKIHQHN